MHKDLGPTSFEFKHGQRSVKRGEVFGAMNPGPMQSVSKMHTFLHYPQKLPNPVMTATKKWEKFGKYQCVGGFSGQCIVPNGDKLMMFYSIYHMGGHHEFRSFAYAESRDGLHWSKPPINKKRTNILIENDGSWPYYELQNVMWDEHGQQYIGLGHCRISEKKWGTFVANTVDPTYWDRKNFRWLYKNDDIHALMGWDEAQGCYVSYIRVPIYDGNTQKRAIGISMSKDFKKWTDPVLCWSPKAGTQQVYNMPVVKYGGTYFGFPINYYPQEGNVGPLETGLIASGNGINWKELTDSYIPHGLPGEWDDCYAMTAAPVEWKGNLLFYYWGCNFPHDTGFAQEKENKGYVGLATLPADRMIGLGCMSHTPGTIYFDRFYLPEGETRIVLNADVSRGSVVCYDGTKKLDLIPKPNGDYYLGKDGKASWKGSTEGLNLSIHLSDAEFFSLRFE